MSKLQLLKLLNACFHLILSYNEGRKEEGGWKYRPLRMEREREREIDGEESLEGDRGEGAGHLTEVE